MHPSEARPALYAIRAWRASFAGDSGKLHAHDAT
jgi:hypothetical protein